MTKISITLLIYEFTFICLIVNQIACHKISYARVLERLLYNIHGCLSCLSLNIQLFNFLYTFNSRFHLLSIASKALRCGIDADQALNSVWVHTRQCHCSLRPDVVAEQFQLFKSLSICEAKYVLSHFLVGHACMVI